MFVRVKTTPNSPRKSIQIVESIRNTDGKVKQKIIRHVGIAENDLQLEKLKEVAEFIKAEIEVNRRPNLFKPEELARQAICARKQKEKNKQERESFLSKASDTVEVKNLKEEQRVVVGIHEIYGLLYKQLGFDSIIKNPTRNKTSIKILEDMVLARIAHPQSKRGSIMTLSEDFGIEHGLDSVYRMMDKLDDQAIKKAKQLSLAHTKKLLQDKLDVIFFDNTTLYFESFNSDTLKHPGFSKDGKHKECQVILALLVSKEGLPVGYEVFPGNTWEGHTLIPVLNKLRQEYQIDNVVFVADAGLLSKDNLQALREHNFTYIIGARLKNMNQKLQKEILNLDNYHNLSSDRKVKRIKQGQNQLIISYSQKRARKDAYDRLVNINKLKNKAIKKNKITDLIGNGGYKKYLKVENNDKVQIDEEKIAKAAKWDGLHGIITNNKNLSDSELLKQYRGLWQVEESFRICKHDLRARPMFHYKEERIKAHLLITFLSFVLVRNLEHRVALQYCKLSPQVIRNCLLHIQVSILKDIKTGNRYSLPSKIPEHAEKIYKLMGVNLRTTCQKL